MIYPLTNEELVLYALATVEIVQLIDVRSRTQVQIRGIITEKLDIYTDLVDIKEACRLLRQKGLIKYDVDEYEPYEDLSYLITATGKKVARSRKYI